MTTPEVVEHAGAPASMPVLRFFDFEGLVELLETATLPFQRWLNASAEAESFLYRRLPDALIHAATTPPPQPRGRLERWWARKEREGEMETVLDLIRAFHLPAPAWIDRWYAETADTTAVWQVQAASDRTIAIRSTVGRVAAAIAAVPDQTARVEPVVYDAADGKEARSVQDALRGRGEQAFEHEVRAVLTHGMPATETTSPTLAVSVDVAALVEAVVVADGSAERRQTLIRKLLERYGLDVPCGGPLAALPAPLPLPMVIEQS